MNWDLLGAKYRSGESASNWGPRLKSRLSKITNIDETVFEGRTSLDSISVARRMFWASRRETTRAEDQAYSLLGVFNVHMPLIYGEGNHAFIRLQQEILKDSTDHSLFAWSESRTPNGASNYGSTFAYSPASFAESKNIIPFGANTKTYSVTNQGLSIQLPLIRKPPLLSPLIKKYDDECIGVLNCVRVGAPFGFIGLQLLVIDPEHRIFRRKEGTQGFARVSSKARSEAKTEDIYILANTSRTPYLVKRARARTRYVMMRRMPPVTAGFHFEGILGTHGEWYSQDIEIFLEMKSVEVSVYEFNISPV